MGGYIDPMSYEAAKEAFPFILEAFRRILFEELPVALRRRNEKRLQELVDKEFEESWDAASKKLSSLIPKTNNYLEPDILTRFLSGSVAKKELAKLIETEDDEPNTQLLYDALEDEGYKESMLEGFDFEEAIKEFAMELGSAIQARKHLGQIPTVKMRRIKKSAEMRLYLQQIAEHCARLDFVGIPELKDKQDLRLDDIFITLRARGQVPEADILPEEEAEAEDAEEIDVRRRDREEARTREAAPIRLNDALKDNRKLLILGGPGAGKTTMLRYVALMLAKEEAEGRLDLPDGLVPICLELSRFADRDNQQQSIGDFIHDYARSTLNVSPPPNFFETFLEQGRCIVLLDGLDEVATLAQRAEVKNVVSSFASRYRGNRFVVTSRIAGYNEASLGGDFQHFTVCDLTQEDVDQFARKWYQAREGDTEDTQKKADDLVRAISASPRVTALARNPLMLTIIALIHRVEAELPNQRIRLYDKCTESLLYTWEAVKKRGEKPMSEEDKRKRLGWIAYWMQTMPGSGGRERTVRRAQLQRRLAELLIENEESPNMGAAEAEAKLFLDQIRRRTGVLIERGLEIYSFAHLTFHEYFAACEVHRRFLDAAVTTGIDEFWNQELKPHLHDPRWQEVVPLFLGKLSAGSSKAASEMVNRILNAGSQYEEILHRDLLLAGRCLADDVAVHEPTKGLILSRLFELLWRGKYYDLRSRSREILVAMRGSRYEDEIALDLVEALSDEYIPVRSNAALLLGELGNASSGVIDALLKALDDEDDDVTSSAASALGEFGDASLNVMDALVKAMGDESDNIRSSIAYALGELGKSSRAVADTLLKALSDEDSVVRSSAASALGGSGQSSEVVVNGLLKAMSDEDSVVRSSAASALGELGKSSRVVADTLLKAMSDEDSVVRSSATSALAGLENSSLDVIGALVKALGDEDWSVRDSAAYALGELGNASTHVIDALTKALSDEDSDVQLSVVYALGGLGKESTDVIDALMKALDHEDTNVRSGAALALGESGRSPGDVMDALVKVLDDKDSAVRSSAAGTLGKLGIASADVANALIKALDDEDSGVRSNAAYALGKLGVASCDVIDSIVKVLSDGKSDVRSSAAYALGKLGSGSSKVTEALLGNLDSERVPSVADAIFEAVSSLAAVEAGEQTQDARHRTER